MKVQNAIVSLIVLDEERILHYFRERFINKISSICFMTKEIKYPSVERIIEYNVLSLTAIKVKKADKAELLSISKLNEIVRETENAEKDIYDKAIVLLKGLVKKHPFASGNRRTAFIVTKDFLLTNNGKFNVKDNPENAKAMQGIREDYYTDEEIKEWIKNGKIKKFKR